MKITYRKYANRWNHEIEIEDEKGTRIILNPTETTLKRFYALMNKMKITINNTDSIHSPDIVAEDETINY